MAQDRDEAWKRCRGNDPDARLTACTTIIESGQDPPAEIASAYYARGAAYRQEQSIRREAFARASEGL